ncbi:MAG: pilus assembly protein PilM [Mobilitalea sp.]
MANKVLSIEVGANKTILCVTSKMTNNPKVYQTIVLDTPYVCVVDGYIKDIKTLGNFISDKLREAKIVINRVVFTISSSKIANREVILPLVKLSKIKEIINANAEDYFPIDVKDYNISYMLLEKMNTKELQQYRLMVLAVHNNLLNTYFELADYLKLRVESIDYIGNSIYHILKKQVSAELNMVVQINEQNTLINVLKKGSLEMQRIIPYGYESVINTMLHHSYYKFEKDSEAFTLLRDNLLINPQFMKSQYGEYSIPTEEQSVEVKREDPVEEITESLHYLVNNVLRVADYYSARNNNAKIGKIYLVGMGAKFQGIEQLFANETGMEAEIINQLRNVTFLQQTTEENFNQSDYMACIGAAIAPIGMIPVKFTQSAEKKNNIVSVTVISSLAILTSIILIATSNQMLKSAEAEKVKLTQEITSLESIDLVYSDHQKLVEEQATILNLDGYCYNFNEEFVSLLNEMELKLPSSATIHSMTTTDSSIVLNITVNSKEAAAMTLIQLKSVEYLTNVNTSGIAEVVDEYGISEVSFSVMADYYLPVTEQEAQ